MTLDRNLSPNESEMSSLMKAGFTKSRVTVVTGAGVSTVSGLPDFRSREGLWTGTDLMSLLSADGVKQHPEEFMAFSRLAIREIQAHAPNIAHVLLAVLQRHGLIGSIITQNVDGYHQAAGATAVVEAHGNMARIICALCRSPGEMATYLAPDEPRCRFCGGLLRPDVVLFGENLTEGAGNVLQAIASETDILLVVGTTMAVWPIALLPEAVRERGGRIAIMNNEPTAIDGLAKWHFTGDVAELLILLYRFVYTFDRKRHGLPLLPDILNSL